VTGSESWIEGIARIEGAPAGEDRQQHSPAGVKALAKHSRHPLLDYKFTNELGQAVSLSDFRGQALAITFFFTRCPLPEFCPRLSKNFQEAERKLSSMAGAPTNWHFLSVSFDPEHDTPEVLRAYGQRYRYDSARWSFLTGPEEQIGELARLSDVTFERSGGSISHNFRTLIIDARGRLQMIFPMGGDLSDDIVSEILKAAGAADKLVPREGVPEQPPTIRQAAVPVKANPAGNTL
jgi:protein SCO1/2